MQNDIISRELLGVVLECSHSGTMRGFLAMVSRQDAQKGWDTLRPSGLKNCILSWEGGQKPLCSISSILSSTCWMQLSHFGPPGILMCPLSLHLSRILRRCEPLEALYRVMHRVQMWESEQWEASKSVIIVTGLWWRAFWFLKVRQLPSSGSVVQVRLIYLQLATWSRNACEVLSSIFPLSKSFFCFRIWERTDRDFSKLNNLEQWSHADLS